MFDSTASVLQTLSGRKLHVLIALFSMVVLPVGEGEIAATVGCDVKTARGHLNALEKLGLVARMSRYDAWTLTTEAHQLPLPIKRLDANAGTGAEPFLETGSLLSLQPGTQPIEPGAGLAKPSSPRTEAVGGVQGYLPLDDDGNGKSYRSTAVHRAGNGKSYRSPHTGDARGSVVVVVDSSSPPFLEQQQQQTTPASGKSYRSATAQFLYDIGMAAPIPELYGDVPLAAVRAFWWYARCQGLHSPCGWIRRRLEQGHEPPDEFLSLAEMWPQLGEEDRRLLRHEATGLQRGRYMHTPAHNGSVLAGYLPDDFWPELTIAALDAYIRLLHAAPDELEVIDDSD